MIKKLFCIDCEVSFDKEDAGDGSTCPCCFEDNIEELPPDFEDDGHFEGDFGRFGGNSEVGDE